MPETISRRRLLQQAAAAGAGLAGLWGMQRGAAAPDAGRPNFLFVFTDDQRWDAFSCMGHPFLRTPHMDRIAREGARFENAFVVDSLCSPSRACFLTGVYPHVHGVTMNDLRDYDRALPTYATVLQQAGYDTGFVGKWHQDSSNAEPRPGFNYWLSFKGHGQYLNCPYNENGQTVRPGGYITDELTDFAVKFLRRPRTAPFCLTVSHKAPHDPRTPAERHKDAFAGVPFPKPESFDDDLRGKPAFLRARFARNADGSAAERVPPGQWDADNQKRMDHYRTLLAVDEGLGRILQTLEETGQLDNTVIVYASDNGYFMGEHRCGDKRLMYEEALRIPLFVRYPRLLRPGTVLDAMTLNIDLAPTFIDLAGARVPEGMQGRSLRPVLAGEKGPWRHSFLYEYFAETPFGNIPSVLGVRTEQYAYITYPELQDLDELYDIRKDPRQVRNLAQDPAFAGTVAEMRAEMERLKKETGYRFIKDPRPPRSASRLNAFVLELEFTREATAAGVAGKGMEPKLSLDDGRDGKKAARFDGRTLIEVPKSEAMDPSGGPWSLDVVVKPEQPDGVILAHGGHSLGYTLFLEEGRPTFLVRTGAGPTRAAAPDAVTGKWVRLTAVIGKDLGVTLYVDGKPAATAKLPAFIERDPAEGLQVGGDGGTPVAEYQRPGGFVGLMESARVFSGELPAARVRADGAQAR